MQTSLQYTLKAAARGALALACLTLCLAQPAPCAGPKQKAPKAAPSQAVPVPGQAFDVYRGQPDMTEDEIVRFAGDIGSFRSWSRATGEEAHPALAGGKPGFVYSAAAASWASSRGWEPVRFFCVMGRTAAAMAMVSEGEDFKSRPSDMPAVSEKECGLVRRYLGELLRAASGADAPKSR
ncbi:MAG: serine/threonine protein phosphatase [Desulfovibrio sp.]|nr:serine/threonine protein phosphatase [Desulfovibrio sp.]